MKGIQMVLDYGDVYRFHDTFPLISYVKQRAMTRAPQTAISGRTRIA